MAFQISQLRKGVVALFVSGYLFTQVNLRSMFLYARSYARSESVSLLGDCVTTTSNLSSCNLLFARIQFQELGISPSSQAFSASTDILRGVTKRTETQSCRGLPSPYVADHASQVLHPDRLGDINIHTSVLRAGSRFRACNAGESGNVDSAKLRAAFVVADPRSGFEAVHDLELKVKEAGRNLKARMALTGMFMSINTRKYREGATLYFSRASRPFTAQSKSSLSFFIKAMSS